VVGSKITLEIQSRKVIFVEGNDDKNFFDILLKKQNMLNVSVLPINGKDQFNKVLPDIKELPNFTEVTHLAIVRDKDQDDAFKSIINIFHKKMGFSLENLPAENGKFAKGKPKIGVFIMPGNSIDGCMLEDLCLKTIENHPAIGCVNDFVSCLQRTDNPPNLKNISKIKTQAFLAAQEEVVNSLGRGAQKDYWDLDSPCLEELKTFLNHLR